MTIESNFKNIIKAIPKDVKLITVSKTRNYDEIMEAYNFGVRDFGENKVQELVDKYDNLPKDINWHLIGHLQRNKVKYIVGKVKLIHSLDSIRLLEEIEKKYSQNNNVANVLIQINIGEEETKTGVSLEELEALITQCTECSFVKVKGLMAIIPKCNEGKAREYFKKMAQIWHNIKNKDLQNFHMEYLSMGMTNDYEIAIEEGSNMVRIGEGVFGKREYNKTNI